MTEQVKQDKLTIDGKEYIISDLPIRRKKYNCC